VYGAARNVAVQQVPDPKIAEPKDMLVRITVTITITITNTNVRGSDLHMYEDRTDMEPGGVLGHENVGEMVEVGNALG